MILLRLFAALNGSLLRRILRRFFGPLLEVVVSDLKVMLAGNLRSVAKPAANDVKWEPLSQFCFAGAAKILEQLWPGRKPGPPNDPVQLRSQVGVHVPVASDNVVVTRLGLCEAVHQVRVKFREDRNLPDTAAGMVFGLTGVDRETHLLPVHISPSQPENLRRASQPTKAAQGEQKPPLGIRACVKDRCGFLHTDKIEPLRVGEVPAFKVRKGVLSENAASDSGIEELPRPLDFAADRAL